MTFPSNQQIALLLCTMVIVFSARCAAPKAPPPVERSRLSIVREQPGSIRVEGVGPIRGFARGRDCTFMHCLELILEATGRRIGYDELMGVSGMAFRTQFRVDKWDVGNPDPLVGDSCLDALFAAIGWQYDLRVVRRDELAEADALTRAIRHSVDQGVPVMAANVIPPEDWGIITGYRRDRLWLCRAYDTSAQQIDQPAAGWPTAVVILSAKKALPDRGPVHVASIRRAVELFDTRASGEYALGRKAFDEWCLSLRSARDRNYLHPNFWTYIGLIDARGAAVRYLRSIAPEFGSKEIHLKSAADAYDEEVRLLLSGLENVPPEYLYSSSIPSIEVRSRQIETLQKARALEEKAIELLKKAV
ncbi:MAG TPA: hypothetical protein VJZ71_12050 [Phycisphaerae bacterium]|nr:hypothetical protein [Phycisphaerae bacterium]